jgi:hypothetical protein
MLGDAVTGRLIGRLLPATLGPMTAQGAAVDRDGDVWVTYAKPATEFGHFAGGDPQPHTCANEIIVLRTRGTPRVSAWLRAGDDVSLGQAVPSPDGRLLAYTEVGCSTAPNGQFLRVTDLRARRSWTIGQRLPGCHPFTTPAWSAAGRQLVEGYAAANLPYNNPGGVCTGPATERLLRLDARRPQPGAGGQVTSPDGNCQVTSTAGLAGGGVLVMEQCGRSPDYTRDFAALLVVGADGRPARTIRLGRCTAAGPVTADQGGGSVLVGARVDCDPTSFNAPASTRLWVYSGGQLRPAATTAGMTLWEWPFAW